MKLNDCLDLDQKGRLTIWHKILEIIESYTTNVSQARVAPEVTSNQIQSLLNRISFPLNLSEAVEFIVQGLWNYQVHCPHPMYFGLFNPTPTMMGVIAETLVGTFNPQLASWNHSPFAVEVEQYLIQLFGENFGYKKPDIDGTFTTGGAEANRTAILAALTHTFPNFSTQGLRGFDNQPTLYVSIESHHSFIRAARACGLGTNAVRLVPVDEDLKIDLEKLSKMIAEDKKAGYWPFFIGATAGTTNSGIIDPLSELADIAIQEDLWYHVDAAWGGAVMFVPEMKYLLKGIENSNSITFDAHKWLSVPMGAGIFLTKHQDILNRTFGISTDYMPKSGEKKVIDPYKHSIQCSRRFIGCKVFLSLAVAGWEGYCNVIRHQVAMGELLRQELNQNGWLVLNNTKLPLVCFEDKQEKKSYQAEFLNKVVQKVINSGKAWVSTTRLNKRIPVIRACITNYRTNSEDVLALVDYLNQARTEIYMKK